ncbi:hypothetical protein JCGZ_11789 [Jatropha curcas]|uniref:DNA-3-methyladenine glycosylase I n=1 Tax=Jatropha curcas TaxID=180498 RepID=A0A067K8S0_JATCU|nr:hypothetical protein JCGZ_11789 [Jatropha curcas]
MRFTEKPVGKLIGTVDFDTVPGPGTGTKTVRFQTGTGTRNFRFDSDSSFFGTGTAGSGTVATPASYHVDEVYVAFHDECWGVPVYDDKDCNLIQNSKLFEVLTLSGMLMDYNWTEILKRRELFREAFAGFDPKIVAKMGEKEITEIASDKTIMLAETRIEREFGSFSSYMWGYVNYKPMINRYKYPRNVPLRTPKAEIISKDLLKRGFRFVGPVIVYSFMQAAGLTIDHLVDCFRYGECVSLAERPWRHI